MALTVHYDPNKLYQDARRIERAIITTMQKIGEEFINEAKLQHQPSVSRRPEKKTGGPKYQGPKEPVYEDQTKNLRSSIGYFILRDLAIVGGRVDGNQEAISEAKAALREIPYRVGIRLIGVAGMGYAAAVESMGYNVITTQSIVAVDQLDTQLKALAKKTGKRTDLLSDAQIF